MPYAYDSFQVMLASSATAYSLATLLKAIDPDVAMTGKEVNLQVLGAGDGGVSGYVTVSASSARPGYLLHDGESRKYGPFISDDIPLLAFFLQGSANSMKVNVEIIH